MDMLHHLMAPEGREGEGEGRGGREGEGKERGRRGEEKRGKKKRERGQQRMGGKGEIDHKIQITYYGSAMYKEIAMVYPH